MTAEDATIADGERCLAELLDRVAPVAPAQVGRARTELACTLAAVRHSAVGATAWRASSLTPNRYPVEVAVTSVSDELRTVVEVIAPEDDPGRALDVALSLAERHGAVPLDARRRLLLMDHQRTFPLRFGAWLGSRHRRASTEHKIYVEVSGDVSAAWWLLDRLGPEARRLIGGLGRPRFVGVPLDGSDGLEIYVRPRLLSDLELGCCLGRAGAGDRVDSMVTAMHGTLTASPGQRLAGRNHGLSISLLDGRCSAVAAFTFAHDRYRLDHRVRERILAAAGAEAWPSEQIYEACTRPLELPRPMRRPWHSALSEVVRTTSEGIERHVGFAPPPCLEADLVPGPDRRNVPCDHPRSTTFRPSLHPDTELRGAPT